MTTKDEELIQLQLLKDQGTAKKKFACLDKRLDDIAEHLEGLARITRLKTSLPELDENGNIRVGFKPFVSHTDQDIFQTIADLREWKHKLTTLNKQVRDSGIDPAD
ncbi:MAG: hypothetical protein F4227_01200 [Gammaproteobacteria bacterium]|nr:hypothetical protein [Gammaproteobacteria bacterium]MYF01625.1 hypothetical protein [Gammaproteobacteria bacterium]